MASVHQQTQRWIKAGCFEAQAHGLREVLRVAAGREAQPTAVIVDSRTVQSTPTGGARAGYDGAKRRKGTKVHAVHARPLARGYVSPQPKNKTAHRSARSSPKSRPSRPNTSNLPTSTKGYTGTDSAQQAAAHGLKLAVIKLDHAKRGFVLLPSRWVVERSFGWTARFRGLARDYERLASSLASLHWLTFVCLMLRSFLSSGSWQPVCRC